MAKVSALNLGIIILFSVLTQLQGSRRETKQTVTRTTEYSKPNCSIILESIKYTKQRFRITGKWTSKRCEVRPGPKFVLRSYHIRPGGKFKLRHHYYDDGSCSNPLHTFSSYGRVRIGFIRKSFRISGAKEIKFRLHKVLVHVHANKSQQFFRRTLETKCSFCWKKDQDMLKHITYPVFYERTDCDCLENIGFDLNELELMKVVQTKDFSRHGINEAQLFVGNVRSDIKDKRYYEAATYQDPMIKSTSKNMYCDVCLKISRSSEFQPPIFSSQAGKSLQINGDWASVRCEIRPQKIFITRQLSFSISDTRWQGLYKHYQDPLCLKLKYSLRAVGRFAIERESTILPSAFDARFDVEQLFVTSHNEKVTEVFNSYRINNLKRILTNLEFNATDEGGLEAVGVRLPYTEYEILKTTPEQHSFVLLTGKRPLNQTAPEKPKDRATSFQDEMRECTNNLLQEQTGHTSTSSHTNGKKQIKEKISSNKQSADSKSKTQIVHERNDDGNRAATLTYSMFNFILWNILMSVFLV